jgi:hypothetical protein
MPGDPSLLRGIHPSDSVFGVKVVLMGLTALAPALVRATGPGEKITKVLALVSWWDGVPSCLPVKRAAVAKTANQARQKTCLPGNLNKKRSAVAWRAVMDKLDASERSLSMNASTMSLVGVSAIGPCEIDHLAGRPQFRPRLFQLSHGGRPGSLHRVPSRPQTHRQRHRLAAPTNRLSLPI